VTISGGNFYIYDADDTTGGYSGEGKSCRFTLDGVTYYFSKGILVGRYD